MKLAEHRSVSARPSVRRVGAYDALYEASHFLWPDTPGRMVVAASRRLAPARALDLGCGDGKNLCYLEQLGWQVDGVDVSPLACAGTRRRLQRDGLKARGWLACDDVVGKEWSVATYDLVIAYGLLHCLRADEASLVVAGAAKALAPGGLLAVAVFNDLMSIPDGHGTAELHLRPQDYIVRRAEGVLKPLILTTGTIRESHDPTIGAHEHSLTWALLEKPWSR